MYVRILNKKAWNEKILPDFDIFLKNLKKEEICITRKSLFNNTQTSFFSKFIRGGQNN